MSSSADSRPSSQPKSHSTFGRILGGGVRVLLSAAIIAVGVAAYHYQMQTGPRAQRKRPPTRAKLVKVISVVKQDCSTTIDAMGTVGPAQRVVLRPEVAGKVVMIAPHVIPGGIVRQGQSLVNIDRRDYEAQLQQRKADAAKALEYLKLELGNQAIAEQEYALLGEVITDEDRELVLRQPQLASARSVLESAEAAMKKAQLDLERCDVKTPFNAIVQDKHIDLGAVAGFNSDLVTLLGTDVAWIEVMVRVDQLKWLVIPRQNGEISSAVIVRNDKVWGPSRFRRGKILRLAGELETQARWARLLVEVQDPFCLEPENEDQPQLLMGTYVHVSMEGIQLKEVCPVSYSHLRDNNTVWVMGGNEQLEIRPVEIAFRSPDLVFVREGLKEGDRLIVTDLGAPVAGMPLRTDTEIEHNGPEEQPIDRGMTQ